MLFCQEKNSGFFPSQELTQGNYFVKNEAQGNFLERNMLRAGCSHVKNELNITLLSINKLSGAFLTRHEHRVLVQVEGQVQCHYS